MTDDELRTKWRSAGGSFFGPRIETGSMPESLLLPYLRSLYNEANIQQQSREMFVARLEVVSKDSLLSPNAVFGLLNDCDMLATRNAR